MAIAKVLYNESGWRVHITRPRSNNYPTQVQISERKFFRTYYYWQRLADIERRENGSYVMSYWGTIDGKFQHVVIDLSDDWNEIGQYVKWDLENETVANFRLQYETFVVTQRILKAANIDKKQINKLAGKIL